MTVPRIASLTPAALERRFEAALERYGLLDVPGGIWGDIAAALLPEVYGEPRRVAKTSCACLPGSEGRIEEMASRHGSKGLLVSLRGLYRDGDRDGRGLREDEATGTAAIARREERDRPKTRRRKKPDPPFDPSRKLQTLLYDEDGLPTAAALASLHGIDPDEAARRIRRIRREQEWAAEQAATPVKCLPPRWELDGRTVSAWTRGEARAKFLERWGLDGRPVKVRDAAVGEAESPYPRLADSTTAGVAE